MRFFFLFFLIAALICGYFWLTDAKGSGMGYATAACVTIAVGVGGYNWITNGSPLDDSTKR